VPRSERIPRALQALACSAALAFPAALWADAPKRVVSINLCTDQLALMLADPGQLISVSRLAHDQQSSAMVDEARALPTNGSGAEEVYLLAPDLVLAGTFTAPSTVNLLRDLGIEVVLFAPARALSDVPDRVAQMGKALGREDRAAELIATFNTELARLSDAPPSERFRAALTYVNSYSSGDKTLAGDILNAAGFDNVASEAGLSSVGVLTLEDLILLAPDVIIQGRDYPGTARAEDNLRHPALRALKGTKLAGELTDRDWICGTPHVLTAIESMRALRLEMEAMQ
jgi:iron complex transport system substrate-binding protein